MPKAPLVSGNRTRQLRILIIALILPLFLFPAGCSGQEKQPATPEGKTAAALATPAAAPAGAANLVTAISRVAKDTIPAVVRIVVIERQEVPNPFYSFENNPFFQFFGGQRKMPRKFERVLQGLGSGMIMDQQGHILTNNHVAGGATKIEVTLSDGTRYPAKLIGADPKTDLAVIQIHAKRHLPTVSFGDSDKVEVGQWVVAIGQPRGLYQTVTQGIISAKHRSGIMDPQSYEDFLQTDAAINPGNSGGPLLTLSGKVIGVNSAIESTSGGFQGIGFAIPSDMALYVAHQLIANGKVTRGWLGVSIQPLTPDLAKSFGMNDTNGALIARVIKGGPAAKAGLKRGDVIVAYRGQPVNDPAGLRNSVATTPIKEKASVTVLRNGHKKTLEVTIGDLENALPLLTASVQKRLGATVRSVPDKLATRLGWETPKGVEVVRLDANGPLAKAGFEVGDVILKVDGQPVNDSVSLAALLDQMHTGQQVNLTAVDHRSGRTAYVQVTLR